MAAEEIISRLKKDFSFLQEEGILGVLLFGSHAKKEIGRRDVDVCIVAPKKKSRELLKKVWRNVDITGKKYDVYIFEELPLYLKWEVIGDHKIIWAKNELDLYEYFYYFRKLQAEQKHRMKISKKEIMKMLHERKRS